MTANVIIIRLFGWPYVGEIMICACICTHKTYSQPWKKIYIYGYITAHTLTKNSTWSQPFNYQKESCRFAEAATI